MNRHFLYLLIIVSSIFIISCDSKPKVITADTAGQSTESTINAATAATVMDAHKVTVNDVLQTEKYTYLNVSENNKTFWIATSKLDAQKGDVYLYRGGLLKTNFESLEFSRTFDTIYLVSNIINAAKHPGSYQGMAIENSPTSPINIDATKIKNAIALSELFKHKDKYKDQTITVVGTCTKANYGIMDRNWVHISDGSKDGSNTLDLTITSEERIQVGSTIALQGKIALNKDFGAGYRYNVILEDAVLVQMQ
ncbi:MAG: GW dipeptide domain-containing protein [Saprospiraceae bacterium]